MKRSLKYLLVICGPTASGKSDVAIQLARHYGTEIISTDSRQLFMEMNIGTAKPSEDQLVAVPHHFINHVSVEQDYNAGTFEKESLLLLEQLFHEKELVIAAGGTGLYINALTDGLDDIPNAGKEIRKEIISEFKAHGLEHLRRLAKEADPDTYELIDTSNHQRLMRIIEVYRVSGKPISFFRKNHKKERSFQIIKIGMDLERTVLYDRINKRVDTMIRDGLLNEVRGLVAHKEKNALQTVGYSELFDHLEGNINLDRATELIKRNSRRYAKRQMTWFRKDESIKWFNPASTDDMINYIDSITQHQTRQTD
ncbi:MAG: tRNA (adenosine(37)-N6)-dimethylallyltransferase MiaA [Bacteroidetes bacterium]|nr:tRNA (adenosine(37)-N6)-dimethylallyltransferase MiaA [Bacteroidota bacterium]